MIGIRLIAALLQVLVTWALLGSALCGLGLGTQRILLGGPQSTGDLRDAPWLGFAVVLLLLLTWHLFLPVNSLVAVAVLGGGLMLSLFHWRLLRDALMGQARSAGAVTIALVVATWIAMRGMGEMTLYDSGMYHVPFVSWAKAHSVVPGLGNLHGRLAFNPASLLFAALLDRGPWTDASQHVTNGFLVALFAVPAAWRISTRRSPRPLTARDAFELTMMPALLVTALRQDVRSLSTDLPTFVLLAMAGGMMFELFAEGGERYSVRHRARRVRIFALLGAVVAVKLSAAPFAATAAVVMLIGDRTWRAADLPRLLALPLLTGVVWMAHGAVLSGYPLYPSRLIALPVDWRVNAEQAAAESGWITMSARNLNTNTLVLSHEWQSRWLGQVLTRGDLFHHFLAPVLVTLLAGLWLFFTRRQARSPWWRGLLVSVPVGASLVVWWFSAPHTRMAQGPFWVLASALSAIAVGSTAMLTTRQRRRLWLSTALLTFVLAARMTIGTIVRASPAERLSTVANTLAAVPSPSGWFWPTPEPDLLSDSLPTGLQLAVPRVDNSCWNGPLLCTPHPTARLALRTPGRVGDGFRLEGAWEPEWFPNPWIPFLDFWRCTRGTLPAVAPSSRESTCRQSAQRGRTDAPTP